MKSDSGADHVERYVRFTRISSESAQARSQEQQLAAIDKFLTEDVTHWLHVRDYRGGGVPDRRCSKLVDMLKRLFRG